jgi:hypothetical protein
VSIYEQHKHRCVVIPMELESHESGI